MVFIWQCQQRKGIKKQYYSMHDQKYLNVYELHMTLLSEIQFPYLPNKAINIYVVGFL